MALRASPPTVPTTRRAKIILFGDSGVGKTWFSLDFPGVYYIDTEGGAREAHYKERMIANGIVEVTPADGGQDFKVVIDEFKSLATQEHSFRTVVLDSFSNLYLLAAAEAEALVGSDFGKDKREANKPTRQLMRWISRMDMNVILVCHSKEKWAPVTKADGSRDRESVGHTFEGYDKLKYDLDLMIEAVHSGSRKPPVGVVRKSRLQEFPLGDRFALTYEEFAKRFGREHLEHSAEAIELPAGDEVAKLERLVKAAEVPEQTITKWKNKANAESFADMPRAAVLACIAHCEAKLEKEVA